MTALTTVATGDVILASHHNEIQRLLKGVAGAGEALTLVYNADAAVTFTPSSNPVAGTRVISITNAAGTVLGSITFDGYFRGATGTVGAPTFSFDGDTDTGIYRTGADAMAVTAAGVQVAPLAIATATVAGFVPTPPNNTTTFLRGDATFATPSSAGAMTLITDTVLSGAAANITFSTIPGTYHHLLIIGQIKGAVSATEAVKMRFNGDAGANYDIEYIRGTGATPSSAVETGTTGGFIGVADGVNGNPIEIKIPNYARAVLNKGALATSFQDNNQIATLHGMRWNSTAAITSVTIYFSSGNNLDTGSNLSLYGVL